jgi:transcriptional regulator with XRE-family HTH domain
METLSERVKKLRKDKGLTQLELANQLNVTDKAVSKWEVGEGNPDISLLPKIAEIFDVTIDYILTGVLPVETVSLDNMDDTKRGVYLTQKDDVENFIKYGYNQFNALINPYKKRNDFREHEIKNQEEIRKQIYNFESLRIFELLLNDLISGKYNNKIMREKSPAFLIYSDIDQFIKMCILSDRLDGLQFIKFHQLAIGDKETQDVYKIKNSNSSKETYLIKEDTLKFIYEDKRVSDKILNFVSTVHFFDKGQKNPENVFYFLNDDLIYYMYHYKKYDLLEQSMKLLYENIKTGIKEYAEYNFSGSWYTHKQVKQNIYYTLCNGNNDIYHHTVAVVEPIKRALLEAKNNLDIKWLETFNDYNREISLKLNEDIVYIDHKNMEILRMQANPSITESEVYRFEYTKLGLLRVDLLLRSLEPSTDNNNVDDYKEALKIGSTVYKEVIKNSYINYYEMIQDLVSKKKYKEIFEFAVDNDLVGLIEVLILGKHDLILPLARKLFTLNLESHPNKNSFGIYKGSWSYLDLLVSVNKDMAKNNQYLALIKNQMGAYNFIGIDIDNINDTISKIKKKLYDNFVKRMEKKIEEITGEQKAKTDYERIMSEIGENYLIELVNNNQLEIAVIKMTVKLEGKLKYLYKYEGEFKEMLDSYINSQLKLENIWDDEDNDYYSARDRDHEKTRITKLLNQLRMVRNSIVHSSSQQEMLTKEELLELIKIIENIKGA